MSETSVTAEVQTAAMPWLNTCPMDERVKFIAAYLRGEISVSRLCDAFGVSRKTAYKWIKRYSEGGVAELVNEHGFPLKSEQLAGAIPLPISASAKARAAFVALAALA